MSDTDNNSGTQEDRRRQRFVWDTLIAVGLVALAVGAALLLWNAVAVFLLAFAGVLLAVFLNTPARFLSDRTPLPHSVTLGLTVLVLVALVGGAGWLAGPAVGQQTADLVETLPQSIEGVRNTIEGLPGGERLLATMEGGGGAQVSGFNIASRVTGTVATVWDIVAKFIFVLFLGLFLAGAPRTYRDGAVRLFPRDLQDRALDVLNALGRTLQGWLLGKLVSMTLVGVLTYIGYLIIGLPMALVLGFLAGLFQFVPIIGPFVAFVPAALIGLTEGTQQALWVGIVYVIIQQLEGNVILPMVYRQSIDVPPALTLIAVFVAAAAFGLLGMLVATPLLAVFLVLVKMLYLHDALDQDVSYPGDSS